MGIQWLSEIIGILRSAGIRAGQAWPGEDHVELTAPAAAVGLRNLNLREGTGTVEVRVLSPHGRGGWICQQTAAEVVTVLEENDIACGMEQMTYRSGLDCFETVIIGQKRLVQQEPEPVGEIRVMLGNEQMNHVTAFSAEQDRKRRLIGSVSSGGPAGVTPGTGGWIIRMVQELPGGVLTMAEPAEPFSLTVEENGLVTEFTGCCWNRVRKACTIDGTKMDWEGYALTGEERKIE